jgi:hypothetical protein
MHYMLDLETIGTSSNAVVTSLAIVNIEDPREFINIEGISIDDQTAQGSRIDGGTLQWWSRQDNALFQKQLAGDVPLQTVITETAKFLNSYQTIWAKGASFDFPILKHMLGALPQHPLNHWGKLRDFRTMYNMYPNKSLKPVREGSAHDALSDAKYQAEHLMEIINYYDLKLR